MTATNLRAAKALIQKPERWIKGQSALDVFRLPVVSKSPVADCWCSVGALGKVGANGLDFKALEQALPGERKPSERNVNEYNDHPDTTHADVLALFSLAISRQEAAERALR